MCSLTKLSSTLHATDVSITGLSFPAWHFLNIALISALLYILGTFDFLSD